jgi:hypothetical protein
MTELAGARQIIGMVLRRLLQARVHLEGAQQMFAPRGVDGRQALGRIELERLRLRRAHSGMAGAGLALGGASAKHCKRQRAAACQHRAPRRVAFKVTCRSHEQPSTAPQ